MKMRKMMITAMILSGLVTGCGNKDVVNSAMNIVGQIVNEDATKEKCEEENLSKNEDTQTASTVSAEFKKAMDSYEAFFDEYIAFMETYTEADDVMTMMTEYAQYMAAYADTMEKMEAIDQDDLSEADLAYYLAVTIRIEEKLLAVS